MISEHVMHFPTAPIQSSNMSKNQSLIMSPEAAPNPIGKVEEAKKQFEASKEVKPSLKTASKTFKPASALNTSNSFVKKEPKIALSYMQAAPPSITNMPPPALGMYSGPKQQLNDMGVTPANTTFQNQLPSLNLSFQPPMPQPPMPQAPPMPPSYVPPSSSISEPLAGPPISSAGSYVTGRLKYFKENDNYGFIVSDLDGENIFFHYSEMKSQSLSKMFLAQAKNHIIRLTFQIVKYIGKYKLSKKAVNIYVTEVTPYTQTK